MGGFGRDEREAAEQLKRLDLSRFSKVHKDKLWQSLNTQSGARQLPDDELDLISAAGVEQPPEETPLGDNPNG